MVPSVVLLAACASNEPLKTNSIRDELNSGGALVSQVERQFELKKVASLTGTLPICVAYRMPATAPWITESFSDVLRTIDKTSKAWTKEAANAKFFHARFVKDTAAAFPAEIAVTTTQTVRKTLPGLPVNYVPIPKERFRAVASCGTKDTVFVDRERITFYTKDFPSDLSWSGEVHLGEVLFFLIDGKPAQAPPNEAHVSSIGGPT